MNDGDALVGIKRRGSQLRRQNMMRARQDWATRLGRRAVADGQRSGSRGGPADSPWAWCRCDSRLANKRRWESWLQTANCNPQTARRGETVSRRSRWDADAERHDAPTLWCGDPAEGPFVRLWESANPETRGIGGIGRDLEVRRCRDGQRAKWRAPSIGCVDDTATATATATGPETASTAAAL